MVHCAHKDMETPDRIASKNVCAKETLSTKWLDEMPEVALDLVRNKKLAPGCALVKLGNDYSRPSAKESLCGKGLRVLP